MKPATLPSAFESVAMLAKWRSSPGGPILKPATCDETTGRLILASDAFLDQLPPISLLSPCPVLVERDGQLIQVVGYDRESGVMAFGDELPDVELGEARELLAAIVEDFHFATPSDRSRALAALITPAMAHGGLLRGRAPIDLGEADQSQSGKGFRNRLTAAIYRQRVSPVTQKQRGGVGSLDESFNSQLVRGAGFVALDNIRGRVDSPAIESFLTEDRYSARVPYSPDVDIDPSRIILMFTSNRAEVTTDLALRSSCVRLLKRDENYEFRVHREGDVLDHVRRNQPRYLAAVFAVVREWFRQGKPATQDTRHDFRAWARRLDWIVQRVLGEAPLLDGHRETQSRMTNPTLNWLRDVALAVIRAGRDGDWLRAHEVLEAIADSAIEIPGAAEDEDLDDDDVRSKVLRLLGRKISKCFAGKTTLQIDAFTVQRRRGTDSAGRKKCETRFAVLPVPPVAPQ